jgi:putative flippase GtrA
MISKLIKKNITFFKYVIVGISSTLIDMTSLYILVDLMKWNLYFSIIISFLLAVINWFLLNKFWTFNDRDEKYKKQFLKFLIVSIIWLLLTLLTMYLLVEVLEIYYLLSKVFTSFLVLFWNYTWNKIWTFKK